MFSDHFDLDFPEVIKVVTAPILFAADVTALKDAELYHLAYAAATPPRREKTDRFRPEKDRRLSLGAEALLRHALRCAGSGAASADFVYGAEKKPYLRDGGLFFNLSHSGIWAVCAVAGCEVGCDVEQVAPIDLKLARRFLPEEYADILSQPTAAERLELFYRYWTLKESFMKATGLGMALPLDAFRIVRGDGVSVLQSVDDRAYGFREFADLPGYRCALCCAGDCSDAQLHILDLEEILREEALCRGGNACFPPTGLDKAPDAAGQNADGLE